MLQVPRSLVESFCLKKERDAVKAEKEKDAAQDAEIDSVKTEISQIKLEMKELKMLFEKALGTGGRPLSARHRDAALAEAQKVS